MAPVVERAYAVTRQTSKLAESARKVTEEFFKKVRAREVKLILKNRQKKPDPEDSKQVKDELNGKLKKIFTLAKTTRRSTTKKPSLDDSEEYKCNSPTLVSEQTRRVLIRRNRGRRAILDLDEDSKPEDPLSKKSSDRDYTRKGPSIEE